MESADSCDQPAGVTSQLKRPEGSKKPLSVYPDRYQPRRTGEPLPPPSPDNRPRLPASRRDECRRSERPGQLGAEAHRGDPPPAVRRRGAALRHRQRRRGQGRVRWGCTETGLVV